MTKSETIVTARARTIVFAAALASALVGTSRESRAQLPLPVPIASAAPAHGVAIKRVGEFDTAYVRFNGQRLFEIAALPATATNVIPPIASRVDVVEDNLRRIVLPPKRIYEVPTPRFDAATFRVEIGKENGFPTLYATDAKRSEIAHIMTVTDADATVNGVPQDRLTEQWREILQQTLAPEIQASAPEHVASELRRAPFVLLGAVALTWLMLWARRRLNRRSDMLHAEANRIGGRDEASARVRRLQTRIKVVEGASWLLSWGTFLLWLLLALWFLTVVPATRGTATTFSRRIAAAAALWFGIIVVNYLIRLGLLEFGGAWSFNPFLSPEDAARRVLRRPMIVAAIDDLKGVVLYLIGIIATLSIFKISPTSVLTIGAIIALVIGFAAQSIVKDYVAGFLILVEDQFAVGDLVIVNGVTGVVESLTLRITQIRKESGTLVTLPNGTITMAENATRGWSRVDFRITISPDSDVEKALSLLSGVVDGFASADDWRTVVLEPPQVLGVESISGDGIVLRAWIKVRPAARRAAFVELNRRVAETFRNAAVALAGAKTSR